MQPVGLIILIVLASLAVAGVIAWTLGGHWMRPGKPRTRKSEAPAPGITGVRTNREVKRVVVPARGGDSARIVAVQALAEAAPGTSSVALMGVPAATKLAAPAEYIESVDGAIDTSACDTTWPRTSWHSTSFHNTTWPATQPFALSQVPTYLAETEPMPLEALTTAR